MKFTMQHSIACFLVLAISLLLTLFAHWKRDNITTIVLSGIVLWCIVCIMFAAVLTCSIACWSCLRGLSPIYSASSGVICAFVLWHSMRDNICVAVSIGRQGSWHVIQHCTYSVVFQTPTQLLFVRGKFGLLYESPSGNQVDGLPLVAHWINIWHLGMPWESDSHPSLLCKDDVGFLCFAGFVIMLLLYDFNLTSAKL